MCGLRRRSRPPSAITVRMITSHAFVSFIHSSLVVPKILRRNQYSLAFPFPQQLNSSSEQQWIGQARVGRCLLADQSAPAQRSVFTKCRHANEATEKKHYCLPVYHGSRGQIPEDSVLAIRLASGLPPWLAWLPGPFSRSGESRDAPPSRLVVLTSVTMFQPAAYGTGPNMWVQCCDLRTLRVGHAAKDSGRIAGAFIR